jgi:hypothetical protein
VFWAFRHSKNFWQIHSPFLGFAKASKQCTMFF